MKAAIAQRLATRSTADWLAVLTPADIWCVEVLDWPALLASEGFRRLDMIQLARRGATAIGTTATPLRVNGVRLRSDAGAPSLGEHTAAIVRELGDR